MAATSRATVAVHDPAQGVGRGEEVARQGREHQRRRHHRRAADLLHLHGSTRVTGGHNVAGGDRAAATTWYFAEGYTGAGFDEYLTILNPNPTAAPVTLTYYLARRRAGRRRR